MTTPEGRVKIKINHVLNRLGAWSFMPVPTGLQGKTIDYLVCYQGWFIGIEAKAEGKEPTGRQEYILNLIREAGGLTFVVSTFEEVTTMEKTLSSLPPRRSV